MAFWKGVMQKKLEPIKCSIIESTNNKESQKLEKQESSNMSEKVYDAIKKAEEKVHDYYTNTWTAILNDLKKKKLNEIKVYKTFVNLRTFNQSTLVFILLKLKHVII